MASARLGQLTTFLHTATCPIAIFESEGAKCSAAMQNGFRSHVVWRLREASPEVIVKTAMRVRSNHVGTVQACITQIAGDFR
jgi:hypothetical protein